MQSRSKEVPEMFVDEATLHIQAGRGGDGTVAFRREKYVPRGGPSGGDGGKGGDVVFVATHNAHTLAAFRHKRHIRSESGQAGGPKNMSGRGGKDEIVEVPVGTLLIDIETGAQVADLTHEGQRFIAARGGDGGKGNQHFASSRNRAPRKATQGFPGEQCSLKLELKLIADVGLVGYPSVGKSTLVAALSNAQPKIAAYPFTTLTPNLGVVRWHDYQEFVIADIPGLIEGAHEGQGLGIQFLKHVERTNVLVHVLEVTEQLEDNPDGRGPIKDYEVLCRELEKFNADLLERPQLVALNKVDLPRVRERADEIRAHFEGLGLECFEISAAGHIGLEELKERLGQMVLGDKVETNGDDGLEWWERDDGIPPKVGEEQE